MTPETFISWIHKNAARVLQYQNGGDGSNGRCDCIGLIIGAWRMSGNTWSWTHGSNYTARYLLKGAKEVSSAKDLEEGMLIFKKRKPGASGYSLPSTYKNHADQNDYYHVGVVTSTNPLEITHCTSVPGGIKKDTKIGTWSTAGWFSKLETGDISDKEKAMYIGKLVAESGTTVNVRNEKGAFVRRLPLGTEVEVISVKDGKAYIKYGTEKYGYVGVEFVADVSEKPGAGGEMEDKLTKLRMLLNEAMVIVHELGGDI